MDAPELSTTVTLTLPVIVWADAHRLATYSKPRESVNLISTPNREDLIEGQIIVIGLASKIVSTNPFEKMLVLQRRWSNSFLVRGVPQDRPDLKKGFIFLSRKIIFHSMKIIESKYLLKNAILIAKDKIDGKLERSL